MRRHATIGLAFALPLAISFGAMAQTPAPPAPPGGAAPASTAQGGASTRGGGQAGTASPPPAGAPGAANAPTGTAGQAGQGAQPAAGTPAAAGGAGGTATPPAGPSAEPRAGVDGASYAVRLRDLEARVDELKDQIRRSHTRLSILSDTIMSGGAAGSRAEVVFQNEMSSAFRLIRALFIIDGTVQYNRQDDTGAMSEQREIPVFSGSVPPGDHTVQVLLNFQGNGYGVFTYLRGYKFEVKSSHSFTAVEGKALTITATALEKGGVTTPLEQRPAIEWREKLQPLTAAGIAGAPAGGGAAPASAGGSAGFSIGGGTK
jgi:hypothetical protein